MYRIARPAGGERLVGGAEMEGGVERIGPRRLAHGDLAPDPFGQGAPEHGDDEQDHRHAHRAEKRPHEAEIDAGAAQAAEEAEDRADDGVRQRRREVARLRIAEDVGEGAIRQRGVDATRGRTVRRRDRDVQLIDRAGDRVGRSGDPLAERAVVDVDRVAARQRDGLGTAQERSRLVKRGRAIRVGRGARTDEQRADVGETLAVGLRGQRVRRRAGREEAPEREREAEGRDQASRGNASAASCRSNPSRRTRRSV